MSNRLKWVIAFFGVTVAAIVMEVWAAADKSDDTQTWTQLIIDNIHWEVFALVWGAFFIWTGAHFGVRYLRKRKTDKE